MINWKVKTVKLSEIFVNDDNPRTISDDAFVRLGKDLEIGHFKVIVIDSNNIILGGNQRYQQLLAKFGKDYEVNVSYPDRELTDDERKRVIVLDNKQRGMDDMDKLMNEYDDVLKDLGFSEEMIEPKDKGRERKDNKIQVIVTLQDTAELEDFKQKLDELILDFPDAEYSVKGGEV